MKVALSTGTWLLAVNGAGEIGAEPCRAEVVHFRGQIPSSDVNATAILGRFMPGFSQHPAGSAASMIIATPALSSAPRRVVPSDVMMAPPLYGPTEGTRTDQEQLPQAGWMGAPSHSRCTTGLTRGGR
ncbi:MAG: hypothetical protein MZV70_32995 [Desulfobacterales bacterium]|nr:hypothetical protein [Desulfobacterales bacterium]